MPTILLPSESSQQQTANKQKIAKKLLLNSTQLIEQACSLDLVTVDSFLRENLVASERKKQAITPLPEESVEKLKRKSEKERSWSEIGLRLIEKKEIAVITLAGGQGTRLGSALPKGCYDIGLVSGKSLFQVQAEKIKKLCEIAGKPDAIRWYVMTSDATYDETCAFFRHFNWFGLPSESVRFFKQGNLPCLSLDGSLMLQSEGQLAVSPNGNGGIFEALDREGILKEMRLFGIRYVHVFSVDNILVRPADPAFLGFATERSVEIACKSVAKRSPDESVGVFCLRDGCLSIVEYTEQSPAVREEKSPRTGELVFSQSNIVNHLFEISFLEQICKNLIRDPTLLPPHPATKKIPYWCKTTKTLVNPSSPNGTKLEFFIFDAFCMAKKFAVLTVDREEEFYPLKNSCNAASFDNAETARNALFRLHRKYCEDAGGEIVDSSDCNVCEISPLLSYAGEGLEFLIKGKKLFLPLHLTS